MGRELKSSLDVESIPPTLQSNSHNPFNYCHSWARVPPGPTVKALVLHQDAVWEGTWYLSEMGPTRRKLSYHEFLLKRMMDSSLFLLLLSLFLPGHHEVRWLLLHYDTYATTMLLPCTKTQSHFNLMSLINHEWSLANRVKRWLSDRISGLPEGLVNLAHWEPLGQEPRSASSKLLDARR